MSKYGILFLVCICFYQLVFAGMVNIPPNIEYARSDFVGFIRVEDISSNRGFITISATARKSLKSDNVGKSFKFRVQNEHDLLNEHSNYFVMLYFKSNENDGISELYSYAYQSIFPDFCEDDYGDCYILARRESIFTQANMMGVNDKIMGYVIVDDAIHAMVNWSAAKKLLHAPIKK